MFSRFGTVVTVVSYGAPTNPIPTNAYAGSTTIASKYRAGYIAYVPCNSSAIIQVNVASDGTFAYGYASTQISSGNVRTSFSYIV